MVIKAATCFKITKESRNAEKFVLYKKNVAFSSACADQIVKMIWQEIFV